MGSDEVFSEKALIFGQNMFSFLLKQRSKLVKYLVYISDETWEN